jgi:hypothetical protein
MVEISKFFLLIRFLSGEETLEFSPEEINNLSVIKKMKIKNNLGLSKIWVKTPSFYDGFKLQWKKR